LKQTLPANYQQAHFIPNGQAAAHPKYTTDTMLIFDEFVDMALMKVRVGSGQCGMLIWR
jgi:hypothetical protein